MTAQTDRAAVASTLAPAGEALSASMWTRVLCGLYMFTMPYRHWKLTLRLRNSLRQFFHDIVPTLANQLLTGRDFWPRSIRIVILRCAQGLGRRRSKRLMKIRETVKRLAGARGRRLIRRLRTRRFKFA